MKTSEKIEAYFSEEHTFKKETQELRKILLTTSLKEDFKWRLPTYTINNKNVLAIGKFKNHYGIWFFNGVFLNDPKEVLRNTQEEKTKAMRQWKFTISDTINPDIILAYCEEAIANEKKGLKFALTKNLSTFKIPALLSDALKNNNKTQQAFNTLPPYKQKEYVEYITQAKQEKTKKNRVKKIIPLIEKGTGLNDKYRNY